MRTSGSGRLRSSSRSVWMTGNATASVMLREPELLLELLELELTLALELLAPGAAAGAFTFGGVGTSRSAATTGGDGVVRCGERARDSAPLPPPAPPPLLLLIQKGPVYRLALVTRPDSDLQPGKHNACGLHPRRRTHTSNLKRKPSA